MLVARICIYIKVWLQTLYMYIVEPTRSLIGHRNVRTQYYYYKILFALQWFPNYSSEHDETVKGLN